MQTQLDRLTEAYLNQIIPLSEYQRRRADLDSKLQGMHDLETQLVHQVDRRNELSGLTAPIEAFCRRVQTGLDNASFEQKRKLVELLIDQVIVKNENVEIRYVIPTSPASEHVRFCHLRKDYFDPHSSAVEAQGHLTIRQVGGQAPGFVLARLPVDQQIGRVDVPGSEIAMPEPVTFTGFVRKTAEGLPLVLVVQPDARI